MKIKGEMKRSVSALCPSLTASIPVSGWCFWGKDRLLDKNIDHRSADAGLLIREQLLAGIHP